MKRERRIKENAFSISISFMSIRADMRNLSKPFAASSSRRSNSAQVSRGRRWRRALVYARAKAVIGFGMGITQHGQGVSAVRCWPICCCCAAISARPGAGICPVRGIPTCRGSAPSASARNPSLVPLDRLAEQYGFAPPRDEGLRHRRHACEAMLAGKVNAFIGLGGNFIRAVPEREAMEAAWRAAAAHRADLDQAQSQPMSCTGEQPTSCRALAVPNSINRRSGPQAVSLEDSTGCFHGLAWQVAPAGPNLLSEPAIIAGIAEVTLQSNAMLTGRFGSPTMRNSRRDRRHLARHLP